MEEKELAIEIQQQLKRLQENLLRAETELTEERKKKVHRKLTEALKQKSPSVC